MGGSVTRINIGSGQRKFAGWINVDISDKYSPDVLMDGMEYLQSLPADSVEMICLHHNLEHYGCGEADGLLRECHRALRSDGSLLVFVPDMQKLARMWISGEMDTQLFMTNVYGAFHGEEGDRHRWAFTRQSLKATLRGAGFSKVFPFDYRGIEGADIARDDRWILGMEAWK